MGTFHIWTDVIFVRSDVYQLKSAMHKGVFSYSKTAPASVWLDNENYSSTFYLITLNKEIDCGRKYGEQNNALFPQKIIKCGVEECESAVHFWNYGIK